MVIRAGGGRYTQRLGISDQVQLGGNAPFQPTTFISGAGLTTRRRDRRCAAAAPLVDDDAAIQLSQSECVVVECSDRTGHSELRHIHARLCGTAGSAPAATGAVESTAPRNSAGQSGREPRMLCGRFEASPASCRSITAGSSIYHSLQVNLNRRLSHGLLFGVAYTWSKSLDFGSDQSYQLPDYYNPQSQLRSQRFRHPKYAGGELCPGHSVWE